MSNAREDSRRVFRQAELAALPHWYSPYRHLSATVGIGLAALVSAVIGIDQPAWTEFWIVPAIVVIANFVEWRAHKNLLHKRRKGFWSILYDQHTPRHHRIFREADMAVRDVRELRFVLMPARGVLGIVLVSVPVAALAGLVFGPNVGWLAMLTQALYVVFYEVTHLCYHLPVSHPVHRLTFIRKMSRHHARHHDPRLMQKWNFNVTLPLADWALGTVAPRRVPDAPDGKLSDPVPEGWD